MCLIVWKPAGSLISRKAMRNAFVNNPHGFGIASFSPRESFYLETGLSKSFNHVWEKVEEHSHLNQLIHFRYATVGGVSENLVHPFEIVKGTYLFHNGTINGFEEIPEGHSDTSYFVEKVLRPEFETNPDCFMDDDWLNAVSYGVGQSRMVILRDDGKIAFVNYNNGCEYGNLWFSNTNYFGGKIKRADPVKDADKNFGGIFNYYRQQKQKKTAQDAQVIPF